MLRLGFNPCARSVVRPAFAILAAGSLWASATPAVAQYGPAVSPPPRDLPDNDSSRQAPTEAARTDVLRAAACLVGRNADAGAPLLRAAPFSRDEREQATRGLRQAERCIRLRDGLATTVLIFRGAVAEALYEAQFPQPPAPRDPAAAVLPFFQPAAAATLDNAAGMTPTYALADCTVAGHSDLVRALLAADPDSDAESAALQALNPVWGACVPPNTSLAINRREVRAILAESLYRWAVVQRDGAASPWAAPAAPASTTAPAGPS
jgi:hypothetical protein